MKIIEANFDGLVGPTHHYGGLAFGNLASLEHSGQVSNPKAAALQGLSKMHLLMKLGIPQAVLPPHERPNLALLNHLGFKGTSTQQLKKAFVDAPKLFLAAYSASSMWAANAGVISPSRDTQDGKLHFTPANLVSQLHRAQEAEMHYRIFKKIFFDETKFVVHKPLFASSQLGDEGAANHTRFCKDYGEKGIHLFVYGKTEDGKHEKLAFGFPARQTLLASQAIARLHGLNQNQVLFARQNRAAIEAGVFHNDVISVGNKNVFLYHTLSFENTSEVIQNLKEKIDFPFYFLPVAESELSLNAAVHSYLFNSQIISLQSGKMMILAPLEAEANLAAKKVLDRLLAEDNPITDLKFIPLQQSMQNGGGPACLRLRVVLTEAEQKACLASCFLNDLLYEKLVEWVERYFRDRLSIEDLLDPELQRTSYEALDALSKLLKLEGIYSFQ